MNSELLEKRKVLRTTDENTIDFHYFHLKTVVINCKQYVNSSVDCIDCQSCITSDITLVSSSQY